MRELHEQSMSRCERREHLEVSDPAHTPSGREYGWGVVSLEELYASESARGSVLQRRFQNHHKRTKRRPGHEPPSTHDLKQ